MQLITKDYYLVININVKKISIIIPIFDNLK